MSTASFVVVLVWYNLFVDHGVVRWVVVVMVSEMCWLHCMDIVVACVYFCW